ncbi:MAG: hypothetical protein AAB355_00110 [Patescibacteria group bacterium]
MTIGPRFKAVAKVILAALTLMLLFALLPSVFSTTPTSQKVCDKKNMCVKPHIKPKDGRCGNLADVADAVTEFNLKNDGKLAAKRIETIDDDKCILIVHLFYSPARGNYAMKKMQGENETPGNDFPLLEECITDSYFTPKKIRDFMDFIGSQEGVVIVGVSHEEPSGAKESFCVIYMRVPAEPKENKETPAPARTIEASFKPDCIRQARGFFFC